ncbi:unnamed protein product [Caenorhabditis auriculariae]|uniref:Mediator of RNA polymerase II transcription subunit 4 n=1 Tax=Caenorhabditis auriculariae TaxID=2777116 RepID=A0A8S1HL01_9PELO|nr:unnamed protein product [Caenorhabditis auriculariae]
MADDDRSLRDLMLETAEDLEAVVKQIIDSLLNRDKNQTQRGGETVTNLVLLFDSKQQDLRRLVKRVPEFQERQALIGELKKCVEDRDKVISRVEINLKGVETALTSIIFTANQKLKSVREAEARPVNTEILIKLAHQISRSYAVAAPLFWQQGDPSRPFPTEPEFRMSFLSSPKANQSSALPQSIGALRQQQQAVRSPGLLGRPSASPKIVPQPPQSQYGWSPRTGYGGQTGSPQSLRAGPRGTWLLSNEGSPYAPKPPTQSPLISPNLSVNIAGRSAPIRPPPVRNVEQMSSDSSSSTSSDDDSPK